MKFQRQDLIARVEAAITASRTAATERNTKAAVDYDAKLAAWSAETSDAWKQLADTIRVRLRAGKPMTSADIPKRLRNGWSSGHIETWDAKPPTPHVADTAALEQLLLLLRAATDEQVSVASIERMGFRPAQLFARAAN